MDYKVESDNDGTSHMEIKGLPSTSNLDDEVFPNTMIMPGMDHSLDTQANWFKAIYSELYDALQTCDGLKNGDTFEVVPFVYRGIKIGAWRFQCVGIHVLPMWESVSEKLLFELQEAENKEMKIRQRDQKEKYEQQHRD